MKKIVCLFLIQFALQSSIMAQQSSYKITHIHDFFSIEETNEIQSSDFILTLPHCECYSMELYGDKIILGTESYQDFALNKEKLITKYQKKVYSYGCGDSTVSYEIEGNKPEKVLFYFYRTAISGPIPTGNFALTDGSYTLLIYNNDRFETALNIDIKDNIIKKL
jgi:hypothetical protein